jgi:hypothetical protein
MHRDYNALIAAIDSRATHLAANIDKLRDHMKDECLRQREREDQYHDDYESVYHPMMQRFDDIAIFMFFSMSLTVFFKDLNSCVLCFPSTQLSHTSRWHSLQLKLTLSSEWSVQTTQWPKRKKDKRTNNDLQNTKKKTLKWGTFLPKHYNVDAWSPKHIFYLMCVLL